MNPHEQSPTEHSDISPAIPLEISAGLAASVDAILQDFAEGAELETALVVERSGALVSGISSEAEVMVEIISALVAGASAAMNSLVKELGSTGNIESFHQSEERAVYLAEIMDRFVIVGVSTVPVPVGVIREKARQVRPALIDLLQGIPVAPPAEEPPAETFSLREMAAARVSERAAQAETVVVEQPEDEITLPAPDENEPVALSEMDPEETVEALAPEEIPGMIFEADEPEEAVEEEAPGEPTEVIEFLQDEAPEIVIEDSSGVVIDSPFETEDDEDDFEMEDTDSFNESIFELEDDDDDIEEEVVADSEDDLEEDAEDEEPIAGIESEEGAEIIFEVDEDEAVPGPEVSSPPVFEIDEEAPANSEGDDDASAFELDFDDFEEDEAESTESVGSGAIEAEEETEEEEASSSGPFYF